MRHNQHGKPALIVEVAFCCFWVLGIASNKQALMPFLRGHDAWHKGQGEGQVWAAKLRIATVCQLTTKAQRCVASAQAELGQLHSLRGQMLEKSRNVAT